MGVTLCQEGVKGIYVEEIALGEASSSNSLPAKGTLYYRDADLN
jgi:hypothetical protein